MVHSLLLRSVERSAVTLKTRLAKACAAGIARRSKARGFRKPIAKDDARGIQCAATISVVGAFALSHVAEGMLSCRMTQRIDHVIQHGRCPPTPRTLYYEEALSIVREGCVNHLCNLTCWSVVCWLHIAAMNKVTFHHGNRSSKLPCRTKNVSQLSPLPHSLLLSWTMSVDSEMCETVMARIRSYSGRRSRPGGIRFMHPGFLLKIY